MTINMQKAKQTNLAYAMNLAKGSLFLKAYVESVVKDTLKSEYHSVITDNLVALSF
jgi:hypothetical protein